MLKNPFLIENCETQIFNDFVEKCPFVMIVSERGQKDQPPQPVWPDDWMKSS